MPQGARTESAAVSAASEQDTRESPNRLLGQGRAVQRRGRALPLQAQGQACFGIALTGTSSHRPRSQRQLKVLLATSLPCVLQVLGGFTKERLRRKLVPLEVK